MNKDFLTLTKLALLENARFKIAFSDNAPKTVINDALEGLNETYIQTIMETSDPSFKSAQELIGDVLTSFSKSVAEEKILEELHFGNYAFKEMLPDIRETEAVSKISHDESLYKDPTETVIKLMELSNDIYKNVEKEIASIYEMYKETT